MHAVVGRWKLDPAQAAQQRELLAERIVPGVRQNPGFVAGYWGSEDGGAAHTFIVFETLAAAEGFRAAVLGNAANQSDAGVGRQDLTIVEIIASA